MPRTPEEQFAWEIQCYGMTEAQVLAQKPSYMDIPMWAMSILSDAQHVLEFSQDEETARQYINKAKFWIALLR